ncbi:uncharacterized protein [Typha angustifolia]|uniref:uncharacterized protein isoform X1 n=1 Tax=Typha angustifolia TaxID=59011 RepID=UPI003C2D28F9
MKLPSSSSFDLNANEATSGCVSGILRRLLCSSFHSGCGDEGNGVKFVIQREQTAELKPSQSPNIVARLMGLDSMPTFPAPPLDAIGRSKSTNSIESWAGFLGERSHLSPLRTSTSFREVPTFLRQENEEFLLLSFAPDGKGDNFPSNSRKSEMGFKIKVEKYNQNDGSVKESGRERSIGKKKKKSKRKEEQNCQKENETRRKQSTSSKEMPFMLENSSITKTKFGSSRSKVEMECISQNSSPVSVLHHPDADEEYSTSDVEETKPLECSRSREVSPSTFESFDCLFRRNCQPTRDHEESKRRTKFEVVRPDVSDIWEHICELAQEDFCKSRWVSRGTCRSSEEAKEIASTIELELFDHLLCEATSELSNYVIKL